jgi:tetratricopeptide (TPR) repeat protein
MPATVRIAGWLLAAACLAVGPAAVAEEIDALQQAAPCREAARRTTDTIDGATTGTAYDAALARLNAVVEDFIAKTGSSEDASLHCLNALGATLLHLGERSAASVVYRRATTVARAVNGDDDDSTLTMQGNLAVALVGSGEFDEAQALQADTLARRESLEGTPHAHKLAITLINLATIESARGELASARQHVERGWALAQRTLSPTDRRMGAVLHNYAMVLDRVGMRSTAQQYFERSLAVRLEAGDAGGAIESLASLAASFFDVGRFAESDRRYAEAYEIAHKALAPLHPVRAEIARSWCRILTAVGKAEESLRRCDEAIAILQTRGAQSRTDIDLTQVNRGIALGLLGRSDEAVDALRSAVHGLRERLPPSTPELMEAVRALGVVLVEAGRLDDGAALLAASFREQKGVLGEMHPDVLLSQGNYGVVLAMQGRLGEAKEVLTDYATKADTMRRLYGRDVRTLRGVFSRFASTRMFLAKILIAQGQCAQAFDWMETTKARTLLDQLRDRAFLDAATVANRELLGSLEQARTRLYVDRARAIGDGARQTDIDSRLRVINEQIGAIISAVRGQESPLEAAQTPSQALLSRNVSADTTIASFGLADDDILIVRFRASDGFQCKSLDPWDGLAETLLAARELQATPGGIAGLLSGNATRPAMRLVRTGVRSFSLVLRSQSIPESATPAASGDEVLETLGRELLGWLVDAPKAANRLIVSPDGLLNLLALDALRIDGQLVVQDHGVTQVASFAPGRSTARSMGRRPTASMIAFGDPVYGAEELPTSANDSARGAALIVRGALDEAMANWPPLPASAVELKALSTSFGLIVGKTLFTREAASVRMLKGLDRSGALARARYLVFSAHALADLQDPELSSVVLSAPPDGGARDAYLTASELAALHLGADLVYFSACETGYGQVVSGEGMLGLSAGALVAGAHATVHTLWNVVDASSAEFTTRFFAAIRRGMSPEAALIRTKRSFVQEPQHASPAYWAPYVLMQIAP